MVQVVEGAEGEEDMVGEAQSSNLSHKEVLDLWGFASTPKRKRNAEQDDLGNPKMQCVDLCSPQSIASSPRIASSSRVSINVPVMDLDASADSCA